MKRSIALLLLLLSTSSFAIGRHAPVPIASPSPVVPIASPSPTASPLPLPSPDPSFTPRVTFEPVEYYSTPAERVKIARAGRKAAQVIQSQCFFDFMSKRALIQTNNRSAIEVAIHLQSLSGVVPVVMYYRCMGKWPCTSAVAYRQPPSMTINLNRAWFQVTDDDCEWAATLGHESYGHSLGGYDHDYNWNRARSFSVPYSIGGADQAQGGDAFDACCE